MIIQIIASPCPYIEALGRISCAVLVYKCFLTYFRTTEWHDGTEWQQRSDRLPIP